MDCLMYVSIQSLLLIIGLLVVVEVLQEVYVLTVLFLLAVVVTASAVRTSPIAYLSSVASAGTVPVFKEFTSGQTQLPNDCTLYQHLSQCIQMIVHVTPSSRSLLPRDAISFFTHFTSAQTSTLQHDLNARAADNQFDKAVDEAIEKKNLVELARLFCTSAPHASDWKEAIPSNKDTTLTNTQ